LDFDQFKGLSEFLSGSIDDDLKRFEEISPVEFPLIRREWFVMKTSIEVEHLLSNLFGDVRQAFAASTDLSGRVLTDEDSQRLTSIFVVNEESTIEFRKVDLISMVQTSIQIFQHRWIASIPFIENDPMIVIHRR
jgi:hypothetical protein